MYDFQSLAFHQRRLELEADDHCAIDHVQQGQLLSLNDSLRQALWRVAHSLQEALKEGLTVGKADLAMLCATEAPSLSPDADTLADRVYTLFYDSQQFLSPLC
jgi:hypothetical protein